VLNWRGKEESLHLSCTGICNHETLHRVTDGESERNHQSRIGDASLQDVYADEMNEGSRVDLRLIFGGGAPPSEWPCGATQNCVATQFRFGHSWFCTLQMGFRTVPVKFQPRRATLTRLVQKRPAAAVGRSVYVHKSSRWVHPPWAAADPCALRSAPGGSHL